MTVASGTLVQRQKLTAYRMVRTFVLGVYGLVVALILLDFGRDTFAGPALTPYYTPLTTLLGVLQGILLLSAAESVYLDSSLTPGRALRETVRHRTHLAAYLAFVALAAVAVIYDTLASPYATTTATDFAGNAVLSVTLDPRLVALVFALFFVFLAYPVTMLLLGAAKVENKGVRNGLYGLAAGISVVTALYVLAGSAMWSFRVDAMGPMYLANAVIFFFVTKNFRRSVALAGLAEQKAVVREEVVEPPNGLTGLAGSLLGKKILCEVDSTVPYEATLGRTLEELAWSGQAIFIFTPMSSPLHTALSGGTGMKFFQTTFTVSRVSVSDETGEVLIPPGDTAIFLDAADKIITSRKGEVVFVFDNLSDLLIVIGLERTYKFLKQFLELLHEPRVTALFLIISGASGFRETNLLRGIFPNQFMVDAKGARLVK